jgi:hypothetical protein
MDANDWGMSLEKYANLIDNRYFSAWAKWEIQRDNTRTHLLRRKRRHHLTMTDFVQPRQDVNLRRTRLTKARGARPQRHSS